jgi:hypothetical protein
MFKFNHSFPPSNIQAMGHLGFTELGITGHCAVYVLFFCALALHSC